MRTMMKNEETRQTPDFVPRIVPAEGSSQNIHRQVREDGICVLTFDRPGSSANIFDPATLAELRQEIDFVAGTPQLTGVILISAKPSIFIAGADLHRMTGLTPSSEIRELLELGQAQIHRLTQLTVPTVAAIHGAAMGGGYEIALACDYRLAASDRVTKIGLPETSLGLLPAWGGATRLPRLIGLPKALDFILAGKTVAARRALSLGMVDELVPAERLLTAAVKKIRAGKPRRPAHWLMNNRLTAAVLAQSMKRRLLRRTRGHYPAVLKAFEVITRGIVKTVPESLALEREGILELVQTDACHNLIRLFFLQERAKKLNAGQASSLSPSGQDELKTGTAPVLHTAVIGAGVMGAGIAQWLSARGLPVVLRDVNTGQVAKGMAGIAKIYRDAVRHHVFTPREARDGLDRIYPAPGEVPLRRMDLVIEAAVENLELKGKIFHRLDELTGTDTILATNTSALPVSELAAGTRRPERVVGLHFFNPVHRMQLVEIVVARQTAREVLQRALRFVQQIGKLPVVVKDSPGFLVNRILMPYLVEAGNLFEHGASLAQLDEAMLDFGMPMGPMRLLDEVGLDVSQHVAQTLAAAFGSSLAGEPLLPDPVSVGTSRCDVPARETAGGTVAPLNAARTAQRAVPTRFTDRLKVPAMFEQMVKAGLLGRKSGGGYYLHGKSKELQPNPQATALVRDQTAAGLTREELQERMVFLMVNEAARCLEEQIVAGPEDVDFAMVMGTGFAPFRGGPLRYADSVGAEKLAGAMKHLVDCGATQFEPCTLLQRMAGDGTKFYPNP